MAWSRALSIASIGMASQACQSDEARSGRKRALQLDNEGWIPQNAAPSNPPAAPPRSRQCANDCASFNPVWSGSTRLPPTDSRQMNPARTTDAAFVTRKPLSLSTKFGQSSPGHRRICRSQRSLDLLAPHLYECKISPVIAPVQTFGNFCKRVSGLLQISRSTG